MKLIVQRPLLFRQLTDCIALACAFLFSQEMVLLLKHPGIAPPAELGLLFISQITWLITGQYSTHLYDDFRSRPFSYEFMAITKTLLLHVCILTFVLFYFFKHFYSPRLFMGIYTCSMYVTMLVTKLAVKKLLVRLRSYGLGKKNILIVGAGETGQHFLQTISANDQYGYQCVGFVDIAPNEAVNGKYLGNISELTRIFEKHEIDDVVLALPQSTREEREHIIVTSEQAAKTVKFIADCHPHCTSMVKMSLFGHFPLISIRATPLDDIGIQQLKRAFDIVFTVLLMIAFSWLFLLIALLIKVTSPGPVIYRQERWGLKNKRMIIYKFRTMRVNCEEIGDSGEYLQAARNDPRITSIGKLLRKTNLDELPQFFNVLRGEMSFVGPRPHCTPMHIEMRKTVKHYMLRHQVKPGITGWAQINGCRGECKSLQEQQKRINFDIWYIENYSIWLDIQIVFQTIVNMIRGDKNAF
ncbi:undecaprenyl-phosphate glucose phosphotransferase [Chitinophaga sp. Hz27]|uniref:undecaprenyl-phosphate glucose phosphotransferase n=1 Tax=Chitinophaga sp. Hz27 TaxID=3347169 RepID=UPI0035DF4FE6